MINHERLRDLLQTKAFAIKQGLWVSCTEEDAQFSDTYVPNQDDGYFVANGSGRIEIERLGQMATAPGSSDLIASPYPTRMKPMSNMRFLLEATKIVVVNIAFRAYDVRKVGSAEQDPATYTAIDNSLLTNDAYVATRFQNTVALDWLNNWFRPRFHIAGIDIVDLTQNYVGVEDAYGNLTSVNLADLSVGLPLPWEFSDLYAVIENDQQLNVIPDVFAQCVQYIPDTGRYVRYPLKCVVDFVVTNSNYGDA